MIKRLSRRYLHVLLFHFTLLGHSAATAYDVVEEHTLLATLLRELNAIDRIATSPEKLAGYESRRYHFDYLRLRADIQRISTGVQHYLYPQRAVPRDGITLHGSYINEAVVEP